MESNGELEKMSINSQSKEWREQLMKSRGLQLNNKAKMLKQK